MVVQDIINHLHDLAPLAYAEDFDNVGLLVGDKNQSITGVLNRSSTVASAFFAIVINTLPDLYLCLIK